MFTSAVVWRGLIYTLLMIFGKLACGLWLIRFTITIPKAIHPHRLSRFLLTSANHFWGRETPVCPLTDQASAQVVAPEDQIPETRQQNQENQASVTATVSNHTTEIATSGPPTQNSPSNHLSSNPLKPLSLHPASILGFAMVSRGEIGFLISSLADSNGIFSTGNNDDIFLIVTWAIVLCTIVGPISVGLLVKRLKRMEMAKEEGGGGRDVLGVWGVR